MTATTSSSARRAAARFMKNDTLPSGRTLVLIARASSSSV
jgi:hypothetical protein